MTLQARPRVLRRALPVFLLVFTTVQFAVFASPFMAADAASARKGIAIELNTARTVSGACLGSFILRNNLGHTLDRFQLDLFVFGDDDVIKLRSNIDLAPLRHDKTTVISFRILAEPCTAVSRVLVNAIPLCRAKSRLAIDCLEGLTVSSRNRIELAK